MNSIYYTHDIYITHALRQDIPDQYASILASINSYSSAKMIPDELWPLFLLIALFICIGILACLTFTVFGIILGRQTADEEGQYRHVVEDDSPTEGYCTFERSFNGPFEDDVPINGQRRAARLFIIPKKKKVRAGTMKRDATSNQAGINKNVGNGQGNERANKALEYQPERILSV